MKTPSPRRRSTVRWILLALLLVAITGGVFASDTLMPFLRPLTAMLPDFSPKKRQLDELVPETVRRGPFRITVVEKGQVDSLKNAVLASKVEGTTTILNIVPEGTYVKQGSMVVELDSAALKEKATQQEISVTQANSAHESALKEVEIQKAQNESDRNAAELKWKLAQLDLEKFLDGDFEQQKNELQSQVSLQTEKTAQAEEVYEFTKRLVKKGYRTQNDLDTARIAWQTEINNLAVVTDKKRVLEKYTYERTVKELQANAAEFQRELARVVLKGQALLSQKEADLAARERTRQVEHERLEKLREQIAACKLLAPQDGQVIYANTRDGRSSDQVLIEVGASVRERQAIVTLPDLNEMKVNARIHESRINLVRQGLPVTVRIDAFSDETFNGMVDTVASVPSSTGSFSSRDLKEYEAVIRLTDPPEKVNRLRPGLSASLEVLVEARDNVLQMPIQSLLTIVGKQFAFVIKGDSVERRSVTVGPSNDRTIEILSGLEEGELVVMNPRSQFERELKELEATLLAEKAAEAPPSESPSLPSSKSDGRPASSGSTGDGRSPAAPGSGRPAAGGATGERPPGAAPGSAGPGAPGAGSGFDPLALFQRLDADSNGKLIGDEISERMRERVAEIDADKDGAISQAEFLAARRSGPPGGARPRPTGDAPAEANGSN